LAAGSAGALEWKVPNEKLLAGSWGGLAPDPEPDALSCGSVAAAHLYDPRSTALAHRCAGPPLLAAERSRVIHLRTTDFPAAALATLRQLDPT